ncbi:MAG: hypothetical protein HC835_09475 [Oscillatoriales cyanobacterium RM2_1_1]|nr:hypothetical protein [Oscillatoriales cyanobacterium RM2_1_1]
MISQPLTSDVIGRWLSLNQGQQSAAYWFQAPGQTTDAFIHRIWSEVTRQESTWTLVSVLFDQSHKPDEPAVQELLALMHQQLATQDSSHPI